MNCKISKFIFSEAQTLKDLSPGLREIVIEVSITPETGYKIVNNKKKFTLVYPPTNEHKMSCMACRNIVDELVYELGKLPICEKCGG